MFYLRAFARNNGSRKGAITERPKAQRVECISLLSFEMVCKFPVHSTGPILTFSFRLSPLTLLNYLSGGKPDSVNRYLHEAGVSLLPAGARLLQLAGHPLYRLRRAERPGSPPGDARPVGWRPNRALHRRERRVRGLRLGHAAARLNGSRLSGAVSHAEPFTPSRRITIF